MPKIKHVYSYVSLSMVRHPQKSASCFCSWSSRDCAVPSETGTHRVDPAVQAGRAEDARMSPNPFVRALLCHRGAAIVEFALVLPVFLLLLFGIFGFALTALYQHLLDDAVRDAARQIQMATTASSSSSSFVNVVCTRLSMLSSTCKTNITYSVKASTVSAGFSGLSVEPLSGSGTYSNSFFSGAPFATNVPILIQVAFPMPFSIPFLGVAATLTQTSSITAVASVRAEPF